MIPGSMKRLVAFLVLYLPITAYAQSDMPNLEWRAGQSPFGGVLVGRTAGPYIVTGLWCRIGVSGDSGATIDVYSAPSGIGGTDGTKISTLSCDPAAPIDVDHDMLAGSAATIPVGETVYLVTNGGSFKNSAGSIMMRVERAAEGRAL